MHRQRLPVIVTTGTVSADTPSSDAPEWQRRATTTSAQLVDCERAHRCGSGQSTGPRRSPSEGLRSDCSGASPLRRDGQRNKTGALDQGAACSVGCALPRSTWSSVA